MKRIHWINLLGIVAVATAASALVAKNLDGNSTHKLLNVSYDPTRELYNSINQRFVTLYRKSTGRDLEIEQSHGGSSRQARTVIEGKQVADVVSLALFPDVDGLRKRGLIADDWANRLPNDSRPYTTTIVFVVRQGNPKHIHGWPDLITGNVEIVTPDPKSSGNGKLSALAAWGAVVLRGGSEQQAHAYLKGFYDHATVLDPGARTSAITFAVEKIGDVHVTWENEALREVRDTKGLEIVYPPVSILAEPYVAWVDANVARHGALADAKAYLEFLFSDQAQDIIGEFGYRPVKQEALAKFTNRFPKLDTFPITAIAKDWAEAQQRFFAENGIIDSVYTPKPRSISTE
jgi:sulfate/thiosulfate transport system substrate-binding protein